MSAFARGRSGWPMAVFKSAVLTGLAMFACNAAAPRSLLFSILFFTVQLYLLFAAQRDGNTRRLWALPLIYIFWANSSYDSEVKKVKDNIIGG